LAAVAKLVFDPLKTHLGNAKKLILSPDGDLWLLPWAALPTGKDRYLIEDYSLRFVVTGRDLVDYGVAQKTVTTAALILADPDYNLTPTQVAEARPVPMSPDTTVAALTRSASDELRGIGRVKRLPGTVAEAKQAFDKLKLLTGQEPKLYQEAQASETIVKATHSPKVMVLATHGFFLKTQEVELKDDPLGGLEAGGEKRPAVLKDKEGKEVENPLLRCGLLLAGANKRRGERRRGRRRPDRPGDRRPRPARHPDGGAQRLRNGCRRSANGRGRCRPAPGVPAGRRGKRAGHALANQRPGHQPVDEHLLR
jgi:hypothetical protein